MIGTRDASDDVDSLLRRAVGNPNPDRLSESDEALLHRIDALADNHDNRLGAAPGSDRGGFDAERIFRDYKALPTRDTIGGRPASALLSPLWVTSFWRMKRRALEIGTTGVHNLLRALQSAADNRGVRFHLIGHSFGAIVCSAALQGPSGGEPSAPVHSLTLIQGAVSLWSFARDIPDVTGTGYFHPIIARRLVTGPLTTTQSQNDTALRWFYKVAATITRSAILPAPWPPRYGAIGTYGLVGLPERTVKLQAAKAQLSYPLAAESVYNVDASAILVRTGLSLQGAHSNLVHPELAGLVWAAALSKTDAV